MEIWRGPIILSFLFYVIVFGGQAIDPVSHNHPVESHHSLHRPLDKSQVYWNFGGSTVMTRNLIRLTPSTQDRRGWLWNEYPLESENWEVEFIFQVHSKPHFGGDGMAFWIMANTQDPAFNVAPDFLNGPVVGMRQDFQGFGVIFDIYDNDNRRNNPAIFVLENLNGGATNFNHDDDYTNDMVQRRPRDVPDDGKAYTNYRCVADFRNTGRNAKTLIKYLHKVLHVYVDTLDGLGYKFCLAVPFEKTFLDYHIAFTAETGQVADMIDIVEITTRYLASSDKETDDSKMPHYSTGAGLSTSRTVLYMLIFVGGLVLTGASGFWLYSFYSQSQVDEVARLKPLNHALVPHYLLHAAVSLLLLIGGHWVLLLANLPLLVWRAVSYFTHSYTFTPGQFRGGGFGLNKVLGTFPRLLVDFLVYLVLQFFYFGLLL